ncbi:MAG: radical SAM protein [Proteobacteria bacterium]|nr:radical SAM protein [Pseudomonadota bacterium]
MTKFSISEIIRQNQEDYSDSHESMTWLTPETAETASCLRKELISRIFTDHAHGPGWQFAGTKLFTHEISPGCTLCGKGDWSCLFINGICNANCFYCPSAQKEKSQPMTGTLEFSNPRDYADYVRRFQIKGVSFSGGEPFLTFERVVIFLKTLRSQVSHPLYIWMYTNGLLVTEDKLKLLRDHGLDEIRFDISANHYSLDTLKKAVGIIPRVTVEIPAIPEDLELTQQVVRELYGLGVHHLNLHQIRCTKFNSANLAQRGYTFVHGTGVTILETELAALKLILYSLDQKIALPINYCSFTFRNQFQRAGASARNARQIKAGHEDVTPTGHIRTLGVAGHKEIIGSIHEDLISRKTDPSLWQLSKTCDQLFFAADLWPLIDFSHVRLKVGYSSTALRPSVSFRNPFREVVLNKNKKVVVERKNEVSDLWFEGDQILGFGQRFLLADTKVTPDIQGPVSRDLENRAAPFEVFRSGLADYF